MGYNSFDTEFKRAMSLTKETLKALINKLGGTVKDEQITDFPSLVNGIEIAGDAADISYDNTTSGLTATDVQSAIDEVYGIQKEVIPDNIVLHDDSEIGEPFVADADTLEGHPASYFATSDQLQEVEQKAGTVKSVAGVQPGEDGNVNLTASQTGAAPSGFGLGGNVTIIKDCDLATSNGWYMTSGDCLNMPAQYQGYSVLVVNSHGTRIAQEYYMMNLGGADGYSCKAIRWKKDEQPWSLWEWINPPMKIGVEYRTAERFNGKPVFVKLVDCGSPGKGDTTVAHGIENIDARITYWALWGNTPLPSYPNSGAGHTAYIQNVSDTNIVIYSGGDSLGSSVVVGIKYTKTVY